LACFQRLQTRKNLLRARNSLTTKKSTDRGDDDDHGSNYSML